MTVSKTNSPPPAQIARDEFCLVAKPIRWRLEDMVVKSDNLTMLQIKEHNAVYKKLCLQANAN